MKIDEVVVAGAVVPNKLGALVVVDENENNPVFGVLVCVLNPPNIGAVVAVDVDGAPKIFVVVAAGAVVPKPVNAGVLVAVPKAGAAALVAVPNIFVVAG